MRVLVAMSGGVDSSVAAGLLKEQGHEVVGATLKLWSGDSGCCSVGDVDDARRVAQQLDIDHHVFSLAEEFENDVVDPYIKAHEKGSTPNPCIECNRHVKFGLLLARSRRLGFDALGTGHHARVERGGPYFLCRGADEDKDQSYVLSMLGQDHLKDVIFPVGKYQKHEVRRIAGAQNLRTAGKPDSQDVCFIQSTEGRVGFLKDRIDLHKGTICDEESGAVLGEIDEVELVTVGQRRSMGSSGGRRYVVRIDIAERKVFTTHYDKSLIDHVVLRDMTYVNGAIDDGTKLEAQVSAHGYHVPSTLESGGLVRFSSPQRPVAPGQTVALYGRHASFGDVVLGAGIAT